MKSRQLKPFLIPLYAAMLWLQALPLARAASDCTGSKWSVKTVFGIEICGGGPNQKPLTDLVNQGLNLLYILTAGSAIVMILVGAIRYITAGSDAKQIQEAKDTITSALSGLALVLVAWAIAQTLGDVLGVTFTEGSV